MPFDNQEIETNRLESEILFFVLKLAERDKLILINSAVIEYENSLNPFHERRVFIEKSLFLAKAYQNLNKKIEERALQIHAATKITAIDSFHLASAKEAKVDYFITCDYDIIKKYKGKLKVVKPLDFIKYYEGKH